MNLVKTSTSIHQTIVLVSSHLDNIIAPRGAGLLTCPGRWKSWCKYFLSPLIFSVDHNSIMVNLSRILHSSSIAQHSSAVKHNPSPLSHGQGPVRRCFVSMSCPATFFVWRQLNLFELIRELGYLIVRARVTSTDTCLCYVSAQSAAPISGGGGLVVVVAISSQWSFDAVTFSTQTPQCQSVGSGDCLGHH